MPPPTLTTIPRELRQHILSYAFDDAYDHDMLFNIRLLQMPLFCHLHYFDDVLKGLTHKSWTCPFDNTTIVPRISTLATNLLATFPVMEDDIVFVLDKTLGLLEAVKFRFVELVVEDMWEESVETEMGRQRVKKDGYDSCPGWIRLRDSILGPDPTTLTALLFRLLAWKQRARRDAQGRLVTWWMV